MLGGGMVGGEGLCKGHQVKTRSLGWAPTQYDRCPYKKGKFGYRDGERQALGNVLWEDGGRGQVVASTSQRLPANHWKLRRG